MFRPFKNGPCVLVIEGLGNQLFQYLMAHQINHMLGCQTTLVTPANPWRVEDRPFALLHLLQNCEHVRLSRDTQTRAIRGLQRINTRLSLLLGISIPFLRLRVEEFEIKDLNPRLLEKATCTGFYLNYNFDPEVIMKVRSEVLGYLKPSNYSSSLGEDFGVMHIRRGDFDFEQFGRLDLDYYRNALKIFSECERFIIVTDSPEQVKNIAAALNIVEIMGPSDLNAWETLELISKSRYFIGSNSSLSWWGGCLAAPTGTSCILPSQWFRHNKLPLKPPPSKNVSLQNPSWENTETHHDEG